MTLAQLMANIHVNPNYEGIVTNDDNVLAINISGAGTAIEDYAVVQNAIEGVDAQLNASNTDKTYIRAGQSTTKTGTQRGFTVSGDRYIGDPFQDHVFSNKQMYGVGNEVVTDYVWFNLLNGKGEKGRASIIANSDGSGNAGETAGIDISIQKFGSAPTEYVWVNTMLGTITVTSIAGTLTGETTVTAQPIVPTGMTALYKTDVAVVLPALDDVVTVGWDPFTSGNDYLADPGDEFAVIYVDAGNKVKYAGKTNAVVAP